MLNRRALLNPTSVYCLVAILALARMVTLSNSQQQQQQHLHPQTQPHQPQQQQQQQPRSSTRKVTSSHHNVTDQLHSNVTHHHHHHQDHATVPSNEQTVQRGRHEDAPPSIAASLTKRRLNGGNLTSSSRSSRHRDLSSMPRQMSARIETLDDISHRLDQATVNPPLEMDDTRVPFWNIAHMINSIGQIDLALRAGSNGIETDVSFDERGRPVEAYHGFPCDCGRHCHHREDFVAFVRHLARITIPPASSRLFVVLFDLKLSDLKETRQKENAGSHLAEILHKYLYAEYEHAARSVPSRPSLEHNLSATPPLRVILSINHAHDLPLTKAFLAYMHKHRLEFMSQFIGWDVGMNDPLENITSAWDSLRGATLNIWQGDGLTNCANMVRGVERLKEAISVRNNQGHFRKVYYWTADVLYHIRSVLRLGLDAILTNQPQRAIQVLNEPEFRGKYRLATPYDDPFQQFWITPSASKMSIPSLGEINETVANIQKTSENFIKTIPEGVAAALNKVHSSIG